MAEKQSNKEVMVVTQSFPREVLFSGHSESETFLQQMVALLVASHYRNSPDDLQVLCDAPAHHLFVLLPPLPQSHATTLPTVLAVIQVHLTNILYSSFCFVSLPSLLCFFLGHTFFRNLFLFLFLGQVFPYWRTLVLWFPGYSGAFFFGHHFLFPVICFCGHYVVCFGCLVGATLGFTKWITDQDLYLNKSVTFIKIWYISCRSD